jgi:L-lactate dehydrogenase (cytochrome)
MPASLLARAASFDDLKRRARRRIPRFAFDYLEGGCNQEIALERNRKALDAIVMEPRYLDDCPEPDLSVTLFGRRYDAPFAVAPVGLGGLLWPRVAEILAEAANKANIPFCLSTVATTSIERAAELAGECFWFQLYTPRDPKIQDDLLDRAAAAGCRVLLVTVDVPKGAWRPRDLRNGLSVPPRLGLRTLLQIAGRPSWALATLRAGIPTFKSIDRYIPKNSGIAAGSAFTRTTFTGGFSREALARMRDRWQGALVLKGIETEREAELALRLGADGIVVSNHGGRQLDASRSPVEVLPQIRAAVGDRMTVLVDSGVESGADIARMLAKGAEGVLVGRAFIYGVGALGRAGGEHTIHLLREELAHFMAQLRCSRPENLARHLPENTDRAEPPHTLRAQAVV